MKTKVKSLLVLPLLATFLVGCGQQANDNPSTSSGADSTSNSTSQSEIKSVKIRFWHTFGQTVVDALSDKIATFENLVKQHDGVDVDIELAYQGGYDDIAKKISDGFAVDNIPTIAVAYPDNVSDYLNAGKTAGKDFVVNLDEFINDRTYGFGKESWLGDQRDESDFIEDFFEEGSKYIVDGTYSLPYMKSTEIMFYNYDMLETAMTYYDPTINSETKIQNFMKNLDWDTFMDLCACIKEHKSAIGNLLEVPAYYDSDSNFFITKMYQNEIPFASITNEGRGAIDFANEPALTKTRQMLEDFYDYGHDKLLTTKGVVNKYGSDYFTNEKCVFSIGSSGGAGYNFPEQDAFTLGVCRVPASNNNPLYVSQGPTLCMFNNLSVSNEINQATKLYAWRFLKYITNGKVNAELCINGSEGYVPVRYSAYETEFFSAFIEEGERYAMCYKIVIDINSDAGYLVSPAFKGSAELRDQCGSLVTATFNATSKEEIPGLIQTAIDNTRQKM